MFTSIFMDNARLHHQSLQEFRPPIALPHDSNTISTVVTNHYHCSTDWLYGLLSNGVQYSFIHNVILQFRRCKVITARPTGGKRKELKRRAQRSSSSGGRVRNIRRRRQRVVDGVPATHCTRRQPASGTRNRPSPTSSCRTRRTFRNRAVRQTAATKPPEQQRVQLSSDSGGDRV